MNKCLVTKLCGVVDNESLLTIGEMRIGFAKVSNPTEFSQSLSIGVSTPMLLSIIGDGYFTDRALLENKGKQITIGSEMSVNAVFVSSNVTQVSLKSKYDIVQFNKYYSSNNSGSSSCIINIDDFKYSAKLTSLSLPSIQVSGDISALKNLTALTSLNLSSTSVSGDISALKNLTALTILALSSTTSILTGDISILKNATNLTSVNISKSKLTGDLALIPSSCRFLSFQNDKGSKFTWSQRSENSKILAIEGSPVISDIDKMLINQAQCRSGISSSDANWYKTITVTGTRTSASDAAVQTLQSKGYTVSITPA